MGKVVKLESKHRPRAVPCTRLRRERARKDSPLTPALKEFIDRVIVPILVEEYLSVTEGEIELAKPAPRATHSLPATRPHRGIGNVRP